MIIHSAAKATSREILDQRWDEAQIRAFGREAFEAMKAIKQKPEIGQKTDPMPEEIPVGCSSDGLVVVSHLTTKGKDQFMTHILVTKLALSAHCWLY